MSIRQQRIKRRDEIINEMTDISENLTYLMSRHEILQIEKAYIENQIAESKFLKGRKKRPTDKSCSPRCGKAKLPSHPSIISDGQKSRGQLLQVDRVIGESGGVGEEIKS